VNETPHLPDAQPDRALPDDFFRVLFEESAASVFVLDFTRVAPLFARLRAEGVQDFVAHLALHSGLTGECRQLVRVWRQPHARVAATGMPSKDELRARFAEITVRRCPRVFATCSRRFGPGGNQIERNIASSTPPASTAPA